MEFIEILPDPEPPLDLVLGTLDRLAGSWGKENSIVPIAGDDTLVRVATSQPENFSAVRQIQLCYDRPLEVVLTTEEQVENAINQIRTKLMSTRDNDLERDEEDEGFSENLKIDVTDATDDDAQIIRYLNSIIFRASKERASDVHIESFEDGLRVRFRVDGALYDTDEKDRVFQAPIISRIKVMAGLNIAEKRLPQDGRISIKIAGKEVDIRVSTIPTQFGERVVMRLLDKTATVLDLQTVGLQGDNLSKVKKLIGRPNGIILVTGPTGSGKTTTLYSCLLYTSPSPRDQRGSRMPSSA